MNKDSKQVIGQESQRVIGIDIQLPFSLYTTCPWCVANYLLQLAALVLLAPSSLDRMLGYGLKFTSGFQGTHLGKIGKPKP